MKRVKVRIKLADLPAFFNGEAKPKLPGRCTGVANDPDNADCIILGCDAPDESDDPTNSGAAFDRLMETLFKK